MSWREQLQKGSYRGVNFRTASADGEIGRRIALHEYPQRDKPYAEDMGRKARRISLDLYVIGDDYMAQRDALIAALETAGAGELVHPWLGTLQVTVLEARGPRESTREGGMARFSVTFVESGEAQFPATTADTAAAVASAADTAAAAVAAEVEVVDVSGPAFLAESAAGLVGKAADLVDQARRAIPGLPATALQFATDLSNLATNAEALLRTPADLAVQVFSVVQGIALLPDRLERAIDAYRQLWNVLADEPAPAKTTPNRTRQAANQVAIAALLQRAALVEAVRTAAAIDYASSGDALLLRDELVDQLEKVMETAGDDLYQALSALRAALVADMAARGSRLPRLTTIIPAVTLPSLVLAQHIYGDATRAGEIVSRNHVRHPGFVPGGVALEVLADA